MRTRARLFSCKGKKKKMERTDNSGVEGKVTTRSTPRTRPVTSAARQRSGHAPPLMLGWRPDLPASVGGDTGESPEDAPPPRANLSPLMSLHSPGFCVSVWAGVGLVYEGLCSPTP